MEPGRWKIFVEKLRSIQFLKVREVEQYKIPIIISTSTGSELVATSCEKSPATQVPSMVGDIGAGGTPFIDAATDCVWSVAERISAVLLLLAHATSLQLRIDSE
jgi:hypothetical protein